MSSPVVPVFYDPRGRRRRRLRRTWLALGVAFTFVSAIFIASVLANPLLPHLNLKPIASLPHIADIKPKPPNIPANPSALKAKRAQAELQRALAKTKRVVPAKQASQTAVVAFPQLPPPSIPANRPLSIGFYINWDESSYASLTRNADHLDWLIPEWAHLQESADGNPLAVDVHTPALNFVRETRPQLRIIPLVENLTDEKWNSDLLARSIADEPSRQRLIQALTQFVEQNKFSGICIDFEEPPDSAQPNLLQFMRELHSVFQPRGWIVLQTVPFDDPDWNYREYAGATDYLILMAYDEHWSVSDAGSIASQSWYENNLANRMRDLDPKRTIIAVGNYGYDWTKGEKDAKEITFQEAVIAARDSDAKIEFDSPTRNPRFEYDEDDDSHHTVWFLDAVTAYNQMRAASGYGPAGFALWRLGSEDPSIWSVFGNSQVASSAEPLKRIAYGYQVDFEGSGEILKVISQPHDGWRNLAIDSSTGFVKGEDFVNLPTSYVIQRNGDRPGLIALTFDDGPDEKWTPAILNILKNEQVPATFFIIGKNGQTYPDLVRRIVNEGHEIGNHTFTHPNLGEMPARVTDLELNATQRLIESLTGRSTVLFRPPYFGDAEADKPSEVEPAIRAEKLGYLMVGLRIDPDDWELPITADEIVKRVVARAMDKDPETRGEVVLLHDSGGDRSATVEALPRLIHDCALVDFVLCRCRSWQGLAATR